MTAEPFKGKFFRSAMCEESYEAVNEEGKVVIKPLKSSEPKKKQPKKSKECVK